MAALRAAWHDPATAAAPVSTADHYSLAGIVTDLDERSGLPGCIRRVNAPASA